MIIRLSIFGDDVTRIPTWWRKADCEICTTQYSHPSITSGQHTNGPLSIWIRSIGGDWIFCRERHLHEVHRNWIDMGIEWFEAVEQENVEDERTTDFV
jgi:hypothetical protein